MDGTLFLVMCVSLTALGYLVWSQCAELFRTPVAPQEPSPWREYYDVGYRAGFEDGVRHARKEMRL